MLSEASFYFAKPVSSEIIMGFASTFDGRLDRMTITDANLKSKSGKPDAEKIVEALRAKYPPAHILLFEKGKDGNKNFPRRSLMLARLSGPEDKDSMFSLIAQSPAEDEALIAADWWRPAAGAGLSAGHAYLMQWPVREINYGMFASLTPDIRNETWINFGASFVRIMLEPDSFHPVLDGKMLRNVLRQNFMTDPLAETIKEKLRRADIPTDGFASLPQGRSVWTLPNLKAQRMAHGVLYREGLVWEREWMDLENYIPVDDSPA